MAAPKIPITGDDDADRLLEEDPLALLLGMLLDQQVPMEWAFTGPSTLRSRLGHLDARKVAAMPDDALVDSDSAIGFRLRMDCARTDARRSVWSSSA